MTKLFIRISLVRVRWRQCHGVAKVAGVVAVVEAAEADKAEAKEMAEIVDNNEVSPAEVDKTVEAVKVEAKEIRVTLVTRVSAMQMGPLLKFV